LKTASPSTSAWPHYTLFSSGYQMGRYVTIAAKYTF